MYKESVRWTKHIDIWCFVITRGVNNVLRVKLMVSPERHCWVLLTLLSYYIDGKILKNVNESLINHSLLTRKFEKCPTTITAPLWHNCHYLATLLWVGRLRQLVVSTLLINGSLVTYTSQFLNKCTQQRFFVNGVEVALLKNNAKQDAFALRRPVLLKQILAWKTVYVILDVLKYPLGRKPFIP